MTNIWAIVKFIWANRELLQKVLKEIMDLFNGADENVKAKCLNAAKCSKSSALAQLGQEANQHARRSRR